MTSIPEIVDGSAMTINPYDTDELAEAMHIMLGNKKLWEHYSDTGFKKSREYSWKSTAAKTLSILLDVADKHR